MFSQRKDGASVDPSGVLGPGTSRTLQLRPRYCVQVRDLEHEREKREEKERRRRSHRDCNGVVYVIDDNVESMQAIDSW